MPNVTIRAAQTKDLPQIEALVQAAYAPWIAIIGARPGPMLDDYAAAIRAGHVTVLVAENERVEAILVLIPQDDAMLLDNVAVLPAAQGCGHGVRLMALAETRSLAHGYDLIRLYTHEKMEANITLYQRHGYRIAYRITERGLPRVYLEKKLG